MNLRCCEIERGKPERRPGKHHQPAARERQHRFQKPPERIAVERSRDHREHRRDEQRDAQPHLQGKDVERKERGPDEVLARPVASGDKHRVPVLSKNRGLLGFVQRTAELLLAILHPGDQVLRQFTNDVVLLRPRAERT